MSAKDVLKKFSRLNEEEEEDDELVDDEEPEGDEEEESDVADDMIDDEDDSDYEDDDDLDPVTNSENKVLKMALKYSKKEFGYLYWPCFLDVAEDRLHVTAKFFGDTPITVEEIQEVLSNIPGATDPIDVSEIEWKPVVFATQNDGAVAVLELTKYPPVIDAIHADLEKFRKDDYATFKPHITVNKDVWEMIESEGLSPSDAGLEMLPLEISIKGLTCYKWGPDEGPVEEIEGVDVHTNNPTGESLATQALRSLQRLSGK